MVSAIRRANAQSAWLVLGGQLVVTALIAVVGGVWTRNWTTALSVLAGGGIGIVATAYMAFSLFRPGADATPGRALRNFVIGWAIKVALTITLLIIAFRSGHVAPLPLVVGYAATYLAYWWAARSTHNVRY